MRIKMMMMIPGPEQCMEFIRISDCPVFIILLFNSFALVTASEPLNVINISLLLKIYLL